jgi:holin-like protein
LSKYIVRDFTICFMIKSLLIIFSCLFLGDGFSAALHIPIPGNVIGMLLLTFALTQRIVHLEDVKPAADLLVKNMAFLFVPPGVGLMVYFDLLSKEFAAIITSFVLSTFLVLAVVGYAQQILEKRFTKKTEE